MAFSDHVVELRKIIGEYAFTLEEIPEIKIKIKLFKYLSSVDSDKIFFSTSHYIKTPGDCGEYRTSVNHGATEELALKRALDTFTVSYDAAVANGEIPSEDWLVPNECY